MKTFVADENQVFHNYYWNSKKQIINAKTKRELKGSINNFGTKVVELKTDQGQFVGRSFEKLRKFSYKKKYLPENYDQYVDVFGRQSLYCFDPNDPTKVFSKKRLSFKKILTNSDGYQFVRIGKGAVYLHIMVMQAHYKMKIDPKVYDVHHKNGLQNNTVNDLLLLTKQEHKKLHNELKEKNNEHE